MVQCESVIENPRYIRALQESHWVQNIPPSAGRIISVDFKKAGKHDVDQPLFEAIRKGIYFPEFPSLNRLKPAVPSTYNEVVEDARSRGLVIGFSGYASGGEKYDYEKELEAVETIFTTLQTEGHQISLAIHGGTREGIPAIANLVALEHKIGSMGILPFRGLDWLCSPGMDYLVVIGADWGDESKTLGEAPDLLFLFGGGKNSLKDCEAAIASGKKLIAVRLKDYPESSAINRIDKKLFSAECRSIEELVDFLKNFRLCQVPNF